MRTPLSSILNKYKDLEKTKRVSIIRNKELIVEHLKIVDDTIKRMANNSFEIKKLSVIIFVAIIGFLGSVKLEVESWVFYIFSVVFLIFFRMDVFYMNLERRFRATYNILRIQYSKQEEVYFFINKPVVDEEFLKRESEVNIFKIDMALYLVMIGTMIAIPLLRKYF